MSKTNLKSGARPRVALVIAVAAGLLVGSAATYVTTQSRHEHPESATEAQKYHCPMHPTYVSDKPGECPICGMKLVPIENPGAGPGAAIADGQRSIAFYRSPMDPSQTSPEPRKDEMGMDYVPVYEDEVLGGSEAVTGLATVQIDAQRRQLIGLRTAAVTRGPIGTGWRTVGRVAIDETRVRKVNVKVDGFVDELFVDFVGKPVHRGQALLSIHSPELLSVQNEYLLALSTRQQLARGAANVAGSGDELVSATRRRLEMWDISPAEIAALERRGRAKRTLTLFSPIPGVVTAKNVVQGSKLTAGDTPFEITDLSQVWVLADAYELDLSRIRVGMPATFTLQAMPNDVFQGRVSFIEPLLDPKTRTAKVRLSFGNPRGELRPDMYGEVAFQAKARETLRVPFDAVIDSGQQKVVFVALGEGRFQPRQVQTGAQSGDFVELTTGAQEGEEVVTRANFLIDSESRLKAALAAVAAAPSRAQAPADPKARAADPHARHGK
jgi:Cu(I)/Ag(I) efflux system membrane fusion protein